MDIEHPAPSVEQSSHGLPELLPERVRLIKQLDTQFGRWAHRTMTRHPSVLSSPMSILIEKDCRTITNIDDEVNRPGLSLRSIDERLILKQSLLRLRPIANQAHNTALDTLDIQNLLVSDYFNKALNWIEEDQRSQTVSNAMAYLKRLYIAREQLAHMNGREGFDDASFAAVVQRVLADEVRLNP